MKKFLSLLLAIVMVLSLLTVNTAVFAEGEPTYDAELLNAEGTKVADLNLSELCGDFHTVKPTWESKSIQDGYTIKLLKDVALTSPVILIGEITIDGNGFKITSTADQLFKTATDTNQLGADLDVTFKTVTIKNLKAEAKQIVLPYYSKVVLEEGNEMSSTGAMFSCTRKKGAHFVINGGTYTVTGNVANASIIQFSTAGVEAEINGGTFVSTTGGAIVLQQNAANVNAANVVTINGGTFHGEKASGAYYPLIRSEHAATITNVYGGNFTIESNQFCARTNGTLNVYGGSFLSTDGAGSIFQARAQSLNIYGGFFKSEKATLIAMNHAATVNIFGGWFHALTDAVIISMDTNSDMRYCNIYDGYFYVSGGNRFAAILVGRMDIYGGYVNCANREDVITVRNGCTLNVHGGTLVNNGGAEIIQNQSSTVNYPENAKLKPTMLKGASVRLVENSYGIRFESEFSADLIAYIQSLADAGSELKYGTLLIPTELLSTAPTVSKNILNYFGLQEGEGYADIVAESGISKDASGNVKIRAALVDLKDENHNLALSAVSYIKYIKNGHEVYVYSDYDSDYNSRSMAYVAGEALKDVKDTYSAVYCYLVEDGSEYNGKYSRYTDKQREILQSYLPTV